MLFVLSILAAIGAALCNGLSAVLQKSGVDSHPRADSLHPGLFWRLTGNIPYVSGLFIDLAAWLLTLVAVHSLPLFVVQPITGLSVLVTLLIEWLFYRKKFSWPTLAAIGSVLMRQTASYATPALAALSGIGFGGTAIAGRILQYPLPYWHIALNPTLWSIIIDGILGVMLFTIALQRHHASTVNAAMITFETIIPVVIGLALLGDKPKGGSYVMIIIGSVITLAATLAILLVQDAHEPEVAEE
jgi:drug/metabolite transporter (DMT)-like permease